MLDDGADDSRLEMKRLQLESKEMQLQKSTQHVVELTLASRMMTSAISKWKEEKQPEVYRLASEFFSDMTEGRWTSVDYDGHKLYVVDSNSTMLTPERLSTGTCQQLYLALRIALLLMAENVGSNLPIVADDVLVNFDEKRSRGAIRALARLAHHRQVILFTCHGTTLNMILDEVRDVRRIDI